MPDVMKPVDGQPWPAGVFLRDSPTWAPSGVIAAPAASASTGDAALSFEVAGSTVTVVLSQFRGRSRGAFYERTDSPWRSGAAAGTDSLATPAYPLNTNTNPRIDRLVLRRAAGSQQVYPFIIQGTPAATPQVPALTQVEGGTWDTPLHRWQLAGGSATSVTNIVDERPWVDTAGFGQGASGAVLTGASSATQVVGSGVWSNLTLPLEEYDPWDSHNPTTNQHIFTARHAQLYVCSASVYWPGNGTGRRGVRLVKNSSAASQTAANARRQVLLPIGASPGAINVTSVIPLLANEYVALQVFQDSGANLTLDLTQAEFTIAPAGPLDAVPTA